MLFILLCIGLFTSYNHYFQIYLKVLNHMRDCFISWDLLLISVKIKKYILNIFKQHVKLDKLKKWNEFVEKVIVTIQNV